MSGMITRLQALRAFSTEALKVVNDVARQQFVVPMRGADPATIDYEESAKAITFTSTDVPKQYQGKGVAKVLAKYAFDYAADKNLEVICQCSYLAANYDKNRHNYQGLKFRVDLHEEEKK